MSIHPKFVSFTLTKDLLLICTKHVLIVSQKIFS